MQLEMDLQQDTEWTTSLRSKFVEQCYFDRKKANSQIPKMQQQQTKKISNKKIRVRQPTKINKKPLIVCY